MRLDINSLVTTNILKINYMHNFFYPQNTNTLIPPTGLLYILLLVILCIVFEGFVICNNCKGKWGRCGVVG